MNDISRQTRNTKTKYSRKSVTRKQKSTNITILKNKTPKEVNALSNDIFFNLEKSSSSHKKERFLITKATSYSPTINANLITLKTIKRRELSDCNNMLAFEFKEPLHILVNNKCIPYYERGAKQLLLKNLAANKHVDVNTIVPPIQSQSNCWFNSMFVVLFISDKGRKFFHFFRQLMIEGKQADGNLIPTHLRDAFAVFNFAIDASLTGNKFAYLLDTNVIIAKIYENIPEDYKRDNVYIKNVGEPGNPMLYYASLITYLNNKSLEYLIIPGTSGWKEQILQSMNQMDSIPHFIILEINDDGLDHSGNITNKEIKFNIGKAKYILDSCIIRDIEKQHFCALLTCENKEMAYDGLSFNRIVKMKWKHKINDNFKWEFDGSNNINGKPLQWNFRKGYQMLLYYRV